MPLGLLPMSDRWSVRLFRQIALVMWEERIMEKSSSSADVVCHDIYIYQSRGRKEQFRISKNKLLSCLRFVGGVRSRLSVHFFFLPIRLQLYKVDTYEKAIRMERSLK
jgi:hypothetical protein